MRLPAAALTAINFGDQMRHMPRTLICRTGCLAIFVSSPLAKNISLFRLIETGIERTRPVPGAFSGVTVVTNACAILPPHARRIGRPAFPAPSIGEGEQISSKPRVYCAARSRRCVSGHHRCLTTESHLRRPCESRAINYGNDALVQQGLFGLTGRSSIPETVVFNRTDRGALDRPVKPRDDN
jgi:hypothetical protein